MRSWSRTLLIFAACSCGDPEAHPLHLGGMRFKMYYGDPSDQTGRVPGNMLPFLGPKKVIYASGAFNGRPAAGGVRGLGIGC